MKAHMRYEAESDMSVGRREISADGSETQVRALCLTE